MTFEDVYTEGITKITATDIQYAKRWDARSSCSAWQKIPRKGIEARVHPMLIDSNHPLATVNDSYNAVFLTGDAVQDTMFYGRVPESFRLRSAVVGDIFDVVRNILWNCCGRIGCTATGMPDQSVSAKLSRNILYACRLKIGMERWHR